MQLLPTPVVKFEGKFWLYDLVEQMEIYTERDVHALSFVLSINEFRMTRMPRVRLPDVKLDVL